MATYVSKALEFYRPLNATIPFNDVTQEMSEPVRPFQAEALYLLCAPAGKQAAHRGRRVTRASSTALRLNKYVSGGGGSQASFSLLEQEVVDSRGRQLE